MLIIIILASENQSTTKITINELVININMDFNNNFSKVVTTTQAQQFINM